MRTTVLREPLAARNPDLSGLRVLVVGLGRSGRAAVRLARDHGARVTVADRRSEEELGRAALDAREAGAEIVAGGHPASLVADADLIVVSPGVPRDVPLLEAAREIALPVWSEVELAARFCRGRIVAITGSNGKSTVTSMVGAILRAAGFAGGTGGNLDVPFCDLLAEDAEDAVHALELSSFQLESVECLRPHVAAILNLSEDHLDRHPSYSDYARAKARVLELQDVEDAAVLNADDAESERFLPFVHGRPHHFSTRSEPARGAFLRRGRLVVRTDDGESTLLPASRLALRGEHNLANALAAALCCRLIGCPADAIDGALADFRPLPHRLEHVATIGDIEFFNDSKATNPVSTARALESFPAGSVQLICGGQDKGTDWAPVRELLPLRARRVLLVGQSTENLRAELSGTVPLFDCETVERAVREGFRGALPGDVVLLAPGCASFDQYRDFQARGEDFRRVVDELRDVEGGDA